MTEILKFTISPEYNIMMACHSTVTLHLYKVETEAKEPNETIDPITHPHALESPILMSGMGLRIADNIVIL